MIKIPLLYDHHNHFFIHGLKSCFNSVYGIKEKEKCLSEFQLKRDLAENDDELIVFFEQDSSSFILCTQELNRFGAIIVFDQSLHRISGSEKGYRQLEKKNPQLSGIWDNPILIEKSLGKILSVLFHLVENIEEHLWKFSQTLISEYGIGKMDDLYCWDENLLPLLNVLPLDFCSDVWVEKEVFHKIPTENKKWVKGIKLFLDGALGSETASLGDKPLFHNDEFILENIEFIRKNNSRLSIHCIGDNAFSQAIRCIEKANFREEGRIQLEHCQFINKNDAVKALEFGVHLCMQPNFSEDSMRFFSQIGEECAKKNNPLRMLLDEVGFEMGKNLFLGSDGMPHGVVGAIKNSLNPPFPGQKITLDEFLMGYCLDSFKKGYIEFNEELEEVKITVHN